MREEQPDGPDDPIAGDEGLLQGLPRGARWLPVAAFVLLVVGFEVLGPDTFSNEGGAYGEWGYVAGAGLVVAAMVLTIVLVNRRRIGGGEQARLFRRAMREGSVPEGADRETWADEVRRRLEVAGDSPATGLFRAAWAPVVAAGGLALAFLGAASGGVVLLLAVLTLAGCAYTAWAWWQHDRYRQRLQVLAEQL